MARKPNYGQQRSEVNRAKQAKKEAKQRERDEAVAKRKASGLDPEPPTDAEKSARD
ncbi:hypothetical protein [Neoroseomonas soli]|uniref:hypothetical protein n=1 Tax=Neoroseomonas soli TaxID=1081025 RepID=UPI001BAE480C|nr:hypothetical protein [Neoroseomonas soli]